MHVQRGTMNMEQRASDNKMHFHQYKKEEFHTFAFIKKNPFLYPKTG